MQLTSHFPHACMVGSVPVMYTLFMEALKLTQTRAEVAYQLASMLT